LKKLRMLTVTMMRYSVPNGNRVTYDQPMLARFGLRCLTALLTVPLAAQQGAPASLEALLKDGDALSKQADYAHAIPVLERAKQLDPQNYRANLLLGSDLLRSGHPAEAREPLRIASQARTTEAVADGYLGEAEKSQANFAGAAEAFMDAVARAPASESALLAWADFSLERFRALGLWLRGSQRGTAVLLRIQAEGTAPGTNQREAFLQKAADGDPEQSGVWGELGIAQLQLGMREEAQASLKKAQRLQPNASSSLILEAQLAAAQGNWDEAETHLRLLGSRSDVTLRSALAQWPQSLVPAPAVTGAIWQCVRDRSPDCPVTAEPVEPTSTPNAETLFAQERWEQLAAMPAFPRAEGRFWFWRGVALGQVGNCAQAIPSLERGLKDGKEAAAYWLIACYGSVVGHTASQLSTQNKEIAVHQIRGDILLSMKGDASGAAAEYTEALRLKPNDAALLEKKAQACFSQGDLEQAQRNARSSLAVDPHRQTTLQLLIRIAMSERDYPQALLLLAKLARMQPDDPWTRVQFATAYAQTGRPQEAVSNLQPVLLAGYPDEKGALHALLAGQLRKLGRDQDAKAAAEQAVKLANTFEQQGAANPQ
jgi:tetratricopeptide (TPR) repeat protein